MNIYIIYTYEAIINAIHYRKANKFKTNRLTVGVIFSFQDLINNMKCVNLAGFEVEIDDTLPDGEIEVNGFRHYVWMRNLKFSDFLALPY